MHCMGQHIGVSTGHVTALHFLQDSPEFTGKTYSAHRLLNPDGSITICVKDAAVAFHAGESQFGELRNLNETFLGLEWLAEGIWNYGRFVKALDAGEITFTDAQYESAGWQYAQWMMAHAFGRDRIAGHSTVAGDDVRGDGLGKHDPGKGFNMQRLQESISTHLTAAEYIG